MPMTDKEFHRYVSSLAFFMDGWHYHAKDNESDGELRMCPSLRHAETGALIWFERDDYRKKVTAHAKRTRMIDGRSTSPYGDGYDAKAGFSQGRDPGAIAKAVLSKVAPTAIKAAAELDRMEREAADRRASQAATIAALNASGLIAREVSTNYDNRAHFYTEAANGTVDEHGSVRLDLRSLTRDRALAVLAALAAMPEAEAAE